jgi:hypothetical protein
MSYLLLFVPALAVGVGLAVAVAFQSMRREW